jgi:hypothetical protein
VEAARLLAELPGGTRFEVRGGDLRLLRAAIEEIAAADARLDRGGARC